MKIPVSHSLRAALWIMLLSSGMGLLACAAIAPVACTDGQQKMVTEHLYFGTDKPDGEVTAEDWRHFLAETVTPRFPQGHSVWPASGQWKSESGPIILESSYVLDIVHSENAKNERAVLEIIDAYKVEHQQEAVLRVKSWACVSF